MINTDVITSTEEFAALKDEWNQLLDDSSSNCLFLTWEWLYTWWRHLGGGRRLHIVTVREDGRLIGIAPLILRPRQLARLLPFKALEFLGSGSVGSDYLSIILRRGCQEAAMEALSEYLTTERMMMECTQVQRSSMLMVNLVLHLRQLGWRSSFITSDICPFIKLEGHDWDSYLATLGRSHGKYFRKKERKLNKEFTEVALEQATTQSQRREALQTLIDLHMKRWNPRGGTNALHSRELLDFHEEMTQHAMEQDWLRLYTLKLDGAPAAALYGFRYRDIFYYYQAGFDPAFSKLSVGVLSLGMSIRQAMADGCREFDMLHGEEEYKYLWAREERELVRLDLFPPKVTGAIYHKTMQLRWGMKNLIRQSLPVQWRDRLMSPVKVDPCWNSKESRG